VGERYHVQIDLARIQSNMLRDEGGRLTERQIRNWLISAGFTPDDDGIGWTADRDALRQLDRTELLEAKPLRRNSKSPARPLPGRESSNGHKDSHRDHSPESRQPRIKPPMKRAKR
jgi:hypothetical protein